MMGWEWSFGEDPMHRLCRITAVSLVAWTMPAFAAPGEDIVVKEPLVIKPTQPTQGAGQDEVYYTITFQEGRAAAAPGAGSAVVKWQPTKPHSPEPASKIDDFTVKQGVKPYKLDRVFVKSWSTSGDAALRPVGTSDLTMKRGTAPAADAPGPNDIRRLIIVTQATGGCTVGKSYSAAIMVGGGKRYELSDVTITDCGRGAGPEEQISLNYERITAVYDKQDKAAPKTKVRGWDPEKKEQ